MGRLISIRAFDLTREPALVAMYLAAITLANLLVSWYGPAVAIANAFFFIGLDLVARDRLHEAWAGRSLWPRMLMLITIGGLLAYALGGDARISLASCLAFIAAGCADALAYQRLRTRPWLARANGSNMAGAAVDSLVFPLLAFGFPLLWGVALGQFAAKVLGGAVWSVLLRGTTGRREERDPAALGGMGLAHMGKAAGTSGVVSGGRRGGDRGRGRGMAMVDPGDEWKTWPEYADWRDPPEGWEAYCTVQAAGVEKGVALSWNGAQYALWRPGWRYDFAPTLAGIAQIMGVDAPRPGYILDQIVTGDARQLAPSLADGSVGLVFCDPVYQNIEDYAWLAEQSLRVLRPRGVCLTWASVPKAGRAQQAMEDAGLEYVYTLFYTVVAKTYRMRWYNLFCWTTPCLWFQRPGEATRPNKWMPDTYRETVILPPEVLDNTVTATANPEDPFAWNKNTGVLRQWMSRFSRPGDVVWDPFAGSGSVPVAAKMLGRRCYASELVAGRADEARARLAATPEPMELSTPASEQAALVFEDAA